MFGTNADSHSVTQGAVYAGNTHGEAQLPGCFDGSGIRKYACKCPVNCDLRRLSSAGGKLAALLDPGEIGFRQTPIFQRLGEEIGGRDGILDG